MEQKPGPARVVAVTATFRRAAEVRRLLAALAASALPLRAVVLVDNADDPDTRAACEQAALEILRLAPGENLGCGGGLALAERTAIERFDPTHLWILDDDAEPEPAALGTLVSALDAGDASAAHALVEDADRRIGWFPGLLEREKFQVVRQPHTPDEFIALCGPAPTPFSWCQGIAMLVRRDIFDQLGFHRADYWVRGEDLEFSLRITHRHRGLYVPLARVRHLPPASASDPATELPKHAAMLQNIAYTSLRLAHGRRIMLTLPGNCLRFLRTWGVGSVFKMTTALWRGAILGKPAGVK